MGQAGLLLLGVLSLLAFGAAGLALATDSRGFTTWHARRTVGMFGQVTEERVSRQAAFGKFIGGAFTAAATFGLVVLIVALVSLLA